MNPKHKKICREYYLKHRTEILERAAARRQADPVKYKLIKAASRLRTRESNRARTQTWRDNNPEQSRDSVRRYQSRPEKKLLLREANIKKRRTDVSFDISCRLRATMASALKRVHTTKKGPIIELIGCSYVDLAAYLEAQFLPGMSWENRKLWHIDHIRPCASFDLTTSEEQRLCFHWSNLRPLWALDNIRKGAKYVK